MKIDVLCVGHLKERYLKDAVAEYAKRLSPYCKLTIYEAEDESIPQNASQAQTDAALLKEAERLAKSLEEKAYRIALAIEGEALSSEGFANRITALNVRGVSHIQFLIGGSTGLHPSLLQKTDMQLSFSAMTFPHQLMRVILLEQIYRCYKIINGEPYHK